MLRTLHTAVVWPLAWLDHALSGGPPTRGTHGNGSYVDRKDRLSNY